MSLEEIQYVDLQSSDDINNIMKVPRTVATMSVTIKNMLEGMIFFSFRNK